MEGAPRKKRLLFLNADSRNFTSQRRTPRGKSVDSKVRRHVMVDIGMSRRKPSKTHQFETIVWSLAETSGVVSSAIPDKDSMSRDVDYSRVPTKDVVVPETAARYDALYNATALTLHALSVFEKEWGEDMFSAYGFTLIMVAGSNAMRSPCSTNTFWFPFAFKKSTFLHHYQQIFTSPNVLVPLYRKSARELKSLALERSLVTIQCVESKLSSSDTSKATSDKVLHAVLAMICYNFTSLDFDQAMIHMKGIRMVIAARGGISTLDAHHDLMLMVSWVDITAALLHDTQPMFPLSTPVASNIRLHASGLAALPTPLLGSINHETAQNPRFMSVLSCLGDLNALASLFRFELATKGNRLWDDEEQMGFLVNPVTHQLLDEQSRSKPQTPRDTISESLRLGALIWIIRVKRRCRSYPGTAEARISTLFQLLSSEPNEEYVWNSPELRVVRLWLLVLCDISGPRDRDLAALVKMIVDEVRLRRSASWAEIMSDIRQMPWVEIFEPECAKLGQQLFL